MASPDSCAENFDLLDLLKSQGEPGDLSEPILYSSETLDSVTSHIEDKGEEKYLISTSISKSILFDVGDEKASHLRHDFVASKTWGSTDQSLSTLGIHSNLTPDAIDAQERKVLELSTSVSATYESLLASYNSKRIAYEELLTSNMVRYFILVVSPTNILTNMRLQQMLVEELCLRCRCGISLERQIERMTGKILQDLSGTTAKEYSRIRNAFAPLHNETRRVSSTFNETLHTLSKSQITNEEEDWVAGLVKKSMRKARQTASRRANTTHTQDVNEVIESHINTLRQLPTKKNMKRICNFPLVVSEDEPWSHFRTLRSLGRNKNTPDSIFKLWETLNTAPIWSDNRMYDFNKLKSKQEALDSSNVVVKHLLRKRSTVQPELTDNDLNYIALSGPGAKLKEAIKEVQEHEQSSKISFDPEVDITDIEEFINSDLMTGCVNLPDNVDLIMNTILKTKDEVHKDAESSHVLKSLRISEISQHASLISDVCTELSYEYKIPHKPKHWGFKVLRNHKVIVLFKCTGSHLFFSLALDKETTTLKDPGRIGPSMYETDNYYISDFSSISEDGLDHFVKSLPFVMMLQATLSQTFNLPIPEKTVNPPPNYWMTLKSIYLLFLNNKLDAEEIVTSVRYLYMNVFQESYRDVTIFAEKLPEVLRSRFSSYLLQNLYKLMRYYSCHSVRRTRIRDIDGTRRYKVHSVKSIFCSGDITTVQMVNSFYYGYVVSKTRGRIGERNVKVVRKIITEEFWFLENIQNVGICLWERRDEPLRHCWDHAALRYIIDTHKRQMNLIYANGFGDILEHDLLDSCSKASFMELATLKASSHEEEEMFKTLDKEDFKSYKAMKEALLESNKTQDGKRPRVILKVFETVDLYVKSTGNKDPIALEVAVWCLMQMNKKGYFVSDCFPKDQHGGDREIHVMHIQARFAQYIFEKFSRVICSYFPSDSIIYPKYKEEFWHSHQKRAQQKLGSHVTICKSADASKWCQRHHSSKFYLLVSRYLPSYMEPFSYILMYLWTQKRIMLPVDIIANFNKNQDVRSSNPFYIDFKKRYYNADAPFVSTKQRNTITCSSGMWQGILHITSTLLHSCIQSFWRTYAQEYLRQQGVSSVVDVIQGSDDSAAMISTNDKRKSAIELCEVLLEQKEEFAKYISIWKSESKSSVGCMNLIEYNSEWYIDGDLCKPTTRWAFACLETTLVEKFSTRLDIYYGVLTQTLESGGTTFLCSLIQMCQAYMHYMLLGCRNHILAREVLDMIISCHQVSLGFFPLDTDLNAGLTGLDFLMFRIYKKFDVPTHTYDIEELSPSAIVEYDEKIDKTVRRDINSTYIAFGNFYIWNKIIEEANVGTLEDILRIVNKNPRELYVPSRNWNSNKIGCSLKLFQPGVRSSLSSYQPNIRMMSSSSYVIGRACMRIPFTGRHEKHSLYSLLKQSDRFYNDRHMKTLRNIDFPHQTEYEDFDNYLDELVGKYFFQTVNMKRTDKSNILIWGSQLVSEIPLMDICIRGWWNVKAVKVSSTMFSSIWRQTKAKFSFIQDTCEDTCKVTGLNHLELFHFIQSIAKRQKKLRLQDTPNKNMTKESAMTRIYWPGIKLRSPISQVLSDIKILRHHIFCYLSFAHTLGHKQSSVISLLTNSIALESRYENLGRSAKRLKIMRDFIINGDVLDLIQKIESLKRGVVGFFKVRQEPRFIKKTTRYKGNGDWVGRVCGVSCNIIMTEKHVDRVTLERLTDLVELSTAIRNLVLEFGLEFMEIPKKSNSGLYLTKMGHFESSRQIVHDSCPVDIDSNLQIEVFDELDNYDWRLQISGTKLRITCQHKMPTNSDPSYTILSDTFTSNDWDPTTIPHNLEDTMFVKWQTGTPVSLHDIIDSIGIKPDHQGIKRMTGYLRRDDPYHHGIYDIKQLSFLARKYLENTYTNKLDQLVHEQLQEELKLKEISDLDVEGMQMLYTFDDPVLDVMEKIDIAKEVTDSNSDLYGEEDSDVIDDNILDRVRDIFFSVQDSYEIETLRKTIMRTSMPKENGFFLNLKQSIDLADLSNTMTNYFLMGDRHPEMIQQLKLGAEPQFVLSMALRKFTPSSYKPSSLLPLELATEAEVSMSSFSEDFLLTKDSAMLAETIDQLQKLLPSVSGLLKDKFEKLIKKYEVELKAINSQGEHSDLGKLSYWHFMDQLIERLQSLGIWEKNLPESDILTIRTILLADCLETVMSKTRIGLISEVDRDMMAAVAWSEIVSLGLLRLITMGLSLHLEVRLNNELIFSEQALRVGASLRLYFYTQDYIKRGYEDHISQGNI